MRVLIVNAYSLSAESRKAFNVFEGVIRSVCDYVDLFGQGSAWFPDRIRRIGSACLGKVPVRPGNSVH